MTVLDMNPSTLSSDAQALYEKMAARRQAHGEHFGGPYLALLNHPELARRVFDEYIAHLREQDFRRGEQFGAPWECFGKDGAHRQNAVYMTSVTLPLSVLQQLDAA